MIRKYIRPGTQLPLRLSTSERDLVVEKAFLDPRVELTLQRAIAVGSKLVVNLNLVDIDDLLGCVAAEANHCDDGKVRRVLDAICDRSVRYWTNSPMRRRLLRRPVPRRVEAAVHAQARSVSGFHSLVQGAASDTTGRGGSSAVFKVTPPAVHTMVLTLSGRGSSIGHPAKLGQFGFEFRRRSYRTWVRLIARSNKGRSRRGW